ncbi:hypothetical protein, variant 1 [Aphanomyces astaci]|uniref:Uncharacterized protein n=1 Tax=Aphanomyces astaci TaxID=112090 RepID=W4H9V5_APHAT|nr:hypothetical protein, variant 1 [Aphanomyces astaci]ETV87903.1 hypothetical protein, variant 1 [Aphanomyces astaci]|eukprot:XP_009822766.1 hypothetical protein, variant 1 [Aphanomyces astaci]
MASSSLWGSLAANVANYGKDLTQDIRDIVSGVDDEHDIEKEGGINASTPGQDEDLDAYIEDLERSLIRKKQEVEAAFKKIEDLEAQLALQRESLPLPVVDDTATRELQRRVESLQSQLEHDRALHATAMNEAVASFDVKLAAALGEAHRWHVECDRLCSSAAAKANEGATSDSPADSLIEANPVVVDAVATLSSVLHAADLVDDDATMSHKLGHYASLVTSRLVAAEVDAKALETTLTAFVLSQGEQLDPPFHLAECKLKLDQVGVARRTDMERVVAEFEQTTGQLQLELAAAQAKVRDVEQRHVQESPDNDQAVRHLQDKLHQSQVNVEHLSRELEATTLELQAALGARDGEEQSSVLVERNMELERMAYAVSDQLAQVKAQLDMERAQWVQHGRANTSAVSEAQWFELKSTLALVEADKNVAQQDADRLHSELLNLHAVLTQFQSRRETEEAQWQAKEASWTSRLAALEADVASSRERQTSTDDVALLKQSVAKKDGEIERLRDALERSAARFHGDTVESVDKRLMVQMMIQLHESPNKSDVLEVMGRILVRDLSWRWS